MPTAKQIANERNELRKRAERARRDRDRAALAALRRHIQGAVKLRAAQRKEVQIMCRAGKAAARERVREIRAIHRSEAAREVDTVRSTARAACTERQVKAREKGKNRVARALAALHHERQHQAHMARYAGPAKLAGPKRSTRRSVEAITESDSEVVNNLPHDMLPVWRAVKSKIKGTPRRSRTEAFFEWVAEHEPDVRTILHRQFDRDVADLIAHEAELREHVMTPDHYSSMSTCELSDVPF